MRAAAEHGAVCNLSVMDVDQNTPTPTSDTPDDFRPLTADEARELRQRLPRLSVWRVVGLQTLAGILVALLAFLLSQELRVALAAGYGSLCVVLPAALFARGVTGRVAATGVGPAVFAFFLWEFVKVAMSVGLLWLSTRLFVNVSWPAMLAGLAVSLQVYLLALGWRHMYRRAST